jgi:hypothetical protein
MPAGADPRTHLASGPWCFVGREALFPGWDSAFPMPEDPYADARSMEAEARAANGEALRLTRLLGGEIDERLGKRRSERYWQMALGPFLLPAAHMLAERQRRIADLVAVHGAEPLRVELLPADIPFSFQSTLDFMVNGIQDVVFNHYVFSRIVESFLSRDKARGPAWRAIYLPPPSLHQAAGAPAPAWSVRCRSALRRLLWNLPFPLCKGFSLGQALLLSLAVISNTGGQEDRSLDFSLYCAGDFRWHFPAEALIRACLPEDLRRGALLGARIRDGARAGQGRRLFPAKLRGMSPAFSQDDAYRLRLAALRESGCRLFSVQHGANYGNLRSVGILPFEYAQHAFFTWGWSTHQGQPANAQPLPHPALAAICGRHRERLPRLILVGTEMSAYTYRLKSRPQAKAMLAYRMRKIAFFRSLLAFLRAREAQGAEAPREDPDLLYRPYFATAGGLDDAEHLLRHLPGIGLCTGDLLRQMLGCRLLAIDHYGTTLHMALAADVPTLAFWNRREWGMEAESDRTLDVLRDAGILCASPEEAARRAAAVWDDPALWWRSRPVREARALWLERYARVGDGADRPWSPWELTRRWFACLNRC